MKRDVVPEILDHLPQDDPEAIRARLDLKRINWLMGNHRWLRRQLESLPETAILELGAGGGEFLSSLSRDHRGLAGLDFAPRPVALPNEINWVTGDIFETLPLSMEKESGPIAILANLFLHHFESESLAELGKLIRAASFICVSEPFRSRISMTQAALLLPLVNRVTRHDMLVSIRAGFRRGELPGLLGLNSAEWQIREQISALGAYRLVAVREK